MQTQRKSKNEIMHGIAEFIVRYRFLIMLLFIVAAVYAGLSLGRVKVSSELTIFLPEETTVSAVGKVDTVYDGVYPSDHYPIWAKVKF